LRRSLARLAAAWLALVCLALVAPFAARAQTTDLATLFPSQATVEVPVTGSLVRLELPAELLARCRSDLSDLRLFDASGREVPYLIESGAALPPPGEAARLEAVSVVRAEVLQARQETEERERAPLLRRESYVLAAPRPAPAGGAWDLVFEIASPDFTGQVEVRPLGTPASTGSAPIASGSIFRLREMGIEKLDIPLGADPGSLEVVLESEGGDFLEPVLRFENLRSIAGAAAIEAPLAVRSMTAQGGVTTVVLERPSGLVPSWLRVTSATPFYQRDVVVWDEGAGARSGRLGEARIARVQGGAMTIANANVALAPARGDALRVVIEDGSSPPLDGISFVALLSQPALIFALPGSGASVGAAEAAASPVGAAGAAAQVTLRLGGGRAFAPRYDVASLTPLLPA
jgi:hypothetical protein